LAPPEKAS